MPYMYNIKYVLLPKLLPKHRPFPHHRHELPNYMTSKNMGNRFCHRTIHNCLSEAVVQEPSPEDSSIKNRRLQLRALALRLPKATACLVRALVPTVAWPGWLKESCRRASSRFFLLPAALVVPEPAELLQKSQWRQAAFAVDRQHLLQMLPVSTGFFATAGALAKGSAERQRSWPMGPLPFCKLPLAWPTACADARAALLSEGVAEVCPCMF